MPCWLWSQQRAGSSQHPLYHALCHHPERKRGISHLELPGTGPRCSSSAWRGDFDHRPGLVPISGPKQGCSTSKGRREYILLSPARLRARDCPRPLGKARLREPLPQGGEAQRSCKADPGSRRNNREDGPRKETARRQWWEASQEAGSVLPRVCLFFLEP